MDPMDEFNKPSFEAQTGQVGTAKHLVNEGEAGAEDKSSKKVPATLVEARHGSCIRHFFEDAGEVNATDKSSEKVPAITVEARLGSNSRHFFEDTGEVNAMDKTSGETSHFGGNRGGRWCMMRRRVDMVRIDMSGADLGVVKAVIRPT